ncbi:MAG: histone H1 [Bacteroidota bacterium]
MRQFDVIQKHVENLKEDFEKFYGRGNKAAGGRVRKGMQELKEMAQEVRVDVKNRKDVSKDSQQVA